ncbi:MAG: anti-sigma factor family protein, partial [Nitriliruptorales bacterium]
MTAPLDPRLAELLSALLDDEVTPDERAAAEAWIARSAEARVEYDELARVRGQLRGLPEVEPPFGFYDRMLRQGTPTPAVRSAFDRRRRAARVWRSTGGVVASVAAAAVLFVSVGGVTAEPVRPPLDELEDGRSAVRALALEETEERVLPRNAEDLELQAAFRGDDRVMGVFATEDGTLVAVYRQEGDVDWEGLPSGVRGEVGSYDTWRDLTTEGDLERIIVAG